MLIPGKTIGILGGGQLGRMLSHAATQLGYRTHIYEPAANCPAGEVATRETNAAYTDAAALAAFAAACDVVTYEFENIPVEPLWPIEKIVPLRPHWSVLETAQNRLREKNWLRQNKFPHVAFAEVAPQGDLAAAIREVGLPCVVKTADFGYDGKGQLKITDDASLANAVEAFADQRAVVEKFIDFQCECSVIVARSSNGEVKSFPIAENIHTNHILDFSIVPARIAPEVQAAARELAEAIAARVELVGLLAVELFVQNDGALLVNEMAPRPHNSGHWTMDGCVTSQFEQHIRAICGLPLGDTALTAPASVMVNILGDAWKWSGDKLVGDPDWAAVLAAPGAHLHLYGKAEPRRARKMGHFNLTGSDATTTLEAARRLKDRL